MIDVVIKIELHTFKKSDIEEPDPLVDEILKAGIRII